MHARAAVEPGDLDPRVLADHPRVRPDRPSEIRLPARVLVVRVAGLRRIIESVQQLDLPAGQRRAQLAELPRIGRAEPRYRRHWTPCTICAAMRGGSARTTWSPLVRNSRKP